MAKKPRWLLDSALTRGRIASRLAVKHALADRLEPGRLDRLTADRVALGEQSDHGPLTAQKTATADERETAEDAHQLIMLIRNAVKRSPRGTKKLRTAIGVGDDTRAATTRKLIATLDAVVANGVDLGACGITSADVVEAGDLAAQLRGKDSTQKATMDARAGSTEERSAAHLRIEAAVDDIHAMGTLQFRRDAAVREVFERLVSSSGPRAEDDPGAPAPVPPA